MRALRPNLVVGALRYAGRGEWRPYALFAGLGATQSGLTRFAEDLKKKQIAMNQCFILRTWPTLQLRLTLPCFGESGECLDTKDRGRLVQVGSPTGLAGDVIVESLDQIRRGADVEYAGLKTEEIDYREALRESGQHLLHAGSQ